MEVMQKRSKAIHSSGTGPPTVSSALNLPPETLKEVFFPSTDEDDDDDEDEDFEDEDEWDD